MLKESIIQSTNSALPKSEENVTSSTQMHPTMPLEHNFPRNMMALNYPIAFLSYTFTETQWKWSTTEQEAYGVYYAVTKWNYYLQGAEVIARNDHKPLARFLNGKNANNKVNRWGLELATHNITFEWILGACNKAADCISCLVEIPQNLPTMINMLSATHPEDLHFTPGVGELNNTHLIYRWCACAFAS